MKLEKLSVGERLRWLILLVTLGLLAASLNVANIKVLQLLWSEGQHRHYLAMFLIISSALFCIGFIEQVFAEKLGQSYVKSIRAQLYFQLMNAPYAQAPKRLGVTMTRLITDGNNLKNWASFGASKLITHGFSVMGYLILLVIQWETLGWTISAIALGSLLFAAMLTPTLLHKAATLRRDRGRMSGHLCERIVGFQSVNQFNQLRRETNKLNRQSEQLATTAVQETQWQSLLTLQAPLLMQVTLAIVIITLVWEQQADKQDLAPLLLLLGLLFHSLREVMLSWTYGITFWVAKQRLELAMETAQNSNLDQKNRLKSRGAFPVQFRDVQLSPHHEPLSKKIEAQDVAIITGDKTSQSQCCLSLLQHLPLHQGRITIDGRRLEWLTPRSLARHVQLIDHHSVLFRGSIKQNLVYGNRKITHVELIDLCHLVGLSPENLETQIKELGRQEPSDMMNRVLIARALAMKPSLLIIDRHDLDRELIDRVVNLREERGFTLVLSGNSTMVKRYQAQRIRIKKGHRSDLCLDDTLTSISAG